MDDAVMVRVVALVRRLRDLPESDWEPRLRTELPDEPAVAATVLRLLRERTTTDDGVLYNLQCAVATPREHTVIGPYRVLHGLGEGGMGSVYLAEQVSPVPRIAAVKVMSVAVAGRGAQQALSRFERERRSLAALEHENVAKLYEAGTTLAGEPWFAMEFVDGTKITDFCERHGLDVRQRVTLFLQVCAGVLHAHQRGVVHRDLKPANVLVTCRDASAPVPSAVAKVIDFGVARDVSAATGSGEDATQVGQLVGTPAYMAPEQALCDPGLIETRTDVYALGVMLYELLSGVLPPSSERLRSARPSQVAAMFAEVDPPPSARCPAARREALRGELDWIVMRAMEREPGRRYSGCDALAAELRRFLRHEPVDAAPPALGYRLRKAWQRNRLLAITSGMTVAALLLGGGLAFTGMVAEAHERGVAQENARRASAWLEWFRLLRGRLELQTLREEAENLYPLPGHEGALRSWLERAMALRTMQASVGAARHALADGPLDPAVQISPADLSFLRRSLESLAEEFAAFFAPTGIVAELETRLVRAANLVRRSIDEPRAAWREVLAAIASSPRYGGLSLVPQVGLVPIGTDPDSGLAEFVVLDTGEVPARRDGRLVLTSRTGVVLVLLPGGTCRIGAVRSPGDRRHDVAAAAQEGPVHDVELGAFFVGKYEVTQGQWLRMTGSRSNRYRRASNFTADNRHPATNLPQVECLEILTRFGLTLPTEAQWEYACRAGTDTPWWTGRDRESLREDGIAANLADRSARQFGATWPPIAEWADYDDGYALHAPVGRLRANAFGLHDVHGNVWEWCLDDGGLYGVDTPRPGDGLCQSRSADLRQSRGGAFSYGALAARSSARNAVSRSSVSDQDGARVARRLFQP